MLQPFPRAWFWLALSVLLGVPLTASAAKPVDAGVRLIMVEQDGCHYCIQWDEEIAPKYPKSAEGRFAPLERAKRGDSVLKDFNPVIYTPTFLVVRDGQEVGRVTGYAGKIFFYEELDEQLVKAGFQPNWGIPELDKTRAPERDGRRSGLSICRWRTGALHMMLVNRRAVVAGLGGVAATVIGGRRTFAAAPPSAAKIMVIGGGPGGATLANALKKLERNLSVTLVEPKAAYSTCFFSNYYIGGFRSFDSITHSYRGLKALGITVISDTATEIDSAARIVDVGQRRQASL